MNQKLSPLFTIFTLCMLTSSVAHADRFETSVLAEEDYARAQTEVNDFNANIDFSTCKVTAAAPATGDEQAFAFTLHTDEGDLAAEGTLACAAPASDLTASASDLTASSEDETFGGGGKVSPPPAPKGESKGGSGKGSSGKTHVRYYHFPTHSPRAHAQRGVSHERCDFFSHHHIHHFHHHESIHVTKAPKHPKESKGSGKAQPEQQSDKK